MRRALMVVALSLLVGACSWLPKPPIQPEPPCTPGSCDRNPNAPTMCMDGECVPCAPSLVGAIWNTDAGEIWCSTPARPVKHWPPDKECPVLTQLCEEVPGPTPQCDTLPPGSCACFEGPNWKPCVPELPEPQCPKFTDRGGTEQCQSDACGCFCEQEWRECSLPGECSFPQGVPGGDFTQGPVLTEFAGQVNANMKEITGCEIGTDCPTGMAPDPWMHAVIEKLQAQGLCAGRHVDTTPGGTDEIAVSASCTAAWEGYKVYNYGGGKVIWSPNANRPSWTITPDHCSGGPVEPPPVGECPLPHPDLTNMKFKHTEHNGKLDTSWVTVNQEPYCREIGMSPMADGTPRADCPVRPEGGEGSEERGPCEAELCDQKWECNGEPENPSNPAQSNCRGHWKTWCSAPGSTAVAEGDR